MLRLLLFFRTINIFVNAFMINKILNSKPSSCGMIHVVFSQLLAHDHVSSLSLPVMETCFTLLLSSMLSTRLSFCSFMVNDNQYLRKKKL